MDSNGSRSKDARHSSLSLEGRRRVSLLGGSKKLDNSPRREIFGRGMSFEGPEIKDEASARRGILGATIDDISRSSLGASGLRGMMGLREHLEWSFQQEMRVLAKLRHPCVLSILGAVVDQVW